MSVIAEGELLKVLNALPKRQYDAASALRAILFERDTNQAEAQVEILCLEEEILACPAVSFHTQQPEGLKPIEILKLEAQEALRRQSRPDDIT